MPQSTAGGAPPRWLAQSFLQGLGSPFVSDLAPAPVSAPCWVAQSRTLAAELGLGEWLGSADALAVLSGSRVSPGTRPHASVYSGHQFGVWAGQLGDGRALLLGEIESSAGRMELQLKGSGPTPYSRRGDGRAVLRSSIREFLASEAMHALGIPTTRALAVVGSSLPVRRETVETAAVLTRVAPSFLRFGHFEHFTHTVRDMAALQRLLSATVERYFPEQAGQPEPAAAFLEQVARRTARLVADWQAVGFCHGVMNTDNMSVLGLTIDYGPFGFLDGFDPGHVCNHSDHQGRYAFARQPSVAFWNLRALAQALLPLMGQGEAASERVQEALEPYPAVFAETLKARLCAKLGLQTRQDGDAVLAEDWLQLLASERTDYTLAWRRLADFTAAGASAVRELFREPAAFDAWAARYVARLGTEGSQDAERALRMKRANPKYVLRNHLAENAIRLAETGDFSECERLLSVLERPFDEQAEHSAYADLPPDWARHLEISCSS